MKIESANVKYGYNKETVKPDKWHSCVQLYFNPYKQMKNILIPVVQN